MKLQFEKLKDKDIKHIIRFADVGMHFNKFCTNWPLRYLYGKYYFLSELRNSTQVLALYHENQLAGVLLADIEGETKTSISWSQNLFVRCCDWITARSKDFEDTYVAANDEMLGQLRSQQTLDGEINFLAADPSLLGHGIGTALMEELQKREKGKTLYVFTDDACSYPFYDHVGFEKKGEKDIVMDVFKKQIPLKCFLYCRSF